MQVRSLKAKDVRMVVGVLGKELPRLAAELDRREGESKEQQASRVGRELLSLLLERHIDALWDWIADLGGMTPDELGEAEAHVPMQIIEAVVTGQSATDFFEHVQHSMSQITGSIKRKRSGTE